MELLFFALFIILCAVTIVAIILSITYEESSFLYFALAFGFAAIFSFCAYTSMSENVWECCGDRVVSNYCYECGKEKPAEYKSWKCCDYELGKNINFCPDCGKAKPTDNNIVNNIIVKDNENVETNVNDNSVVIVEDKWTCCDKERESKFCPDCGNAKLDNDAAVKSETIIKDNNR